MDNFDNELTKEQLNKFRELVPAIADMLGVETKAAYNAGISAECDYVTGMRVMTISIADDVDGNERELILLAKVCDEEKASHAYECLPMAYVRCARKENK